MQVHFLKNTFLVSIVLWGLVCLQYSCGHAGLPAELEHLEDELPNEVSYNFHIKPILSDRCFNCHGPDADNREGDLRLDLPGLDCGKEVYRRILSDDPDVQMPPPDSKLSLSEYEQAVLIKWIDQGAEYADHWSFSAVQAHEVPVEEHPIDYFIDRKLEEKGLTPQGPAEREQLVRRVSFDLTGLPPSLEDIDRLKNNFTEEAYHQLIDKYLASEAYGERMAADWMDVARYADSDGYLDDKHRDFTPWRDWVIKSFNENMPYDQFVTWQVAGDLIEDPTPESILSTAFNRLHRKNSEAGIVFEEYRVEYVADRVHTFGKAFLGLTTECARCHDHKYDPISQKEYYELFAFFNSTDEMGTAIYGPDQTPGPSMLLSTPEQVKILQFLEKKISQQEEEVRAIQAKYSDPINAEKAPEEIAQSHRNKLVAHYTFDNAKVTTKGKTVMANEILPTASASLSEAKLGEGYEGKGLVVTDYGSARLAEKEGWYDRFDQFSVSLWVQPVAVHEEAGIFSHSEDMRLGYKGYSMHLANNRPRFIMAHSWPFNSIEVIAKNTLPVNKWSHLTLTYDGSSRADGVRIYIDGELQELEIVVDHLYKGILFEYNIHTYGFHGFRFGYRDKIKNLKGGVLDEVKIFDGVLSQAEVWQDMGTQKMPNAILSDHFAQSDLEKNSTVLDSLRNSRVQLNETINGIPEIMVLGDAPQTRPSYLLQRGSYNQRGEEVFPNTPGKISPAFEEFAKNRLGLATWLFHGDNPLTARVFVNRIWQQHFGRGLVKTAEDFGAQGELPTHPELLDYLATYFRESDWDIHALHKLIVTSGAYQRSSVVSSEIASLDPENIYYAKGPSQRLTAEMIRDNALQISDLLVDRVGGESEYPYQPDGLWDEISNKSWRYPYLQEPGEGLYRRSLYTIWKRTSPPPSMLIFDAPDRSFCTVQRSETNTPLQALVLLNDPQYVEAARVMAANTLKKFSSVQDQLRHLARLVWGRSPDAYELAELEEFFAQEKLRVRSDQDLAQAYLSNGATEITDQESMDELVALAKTAHGLLNTYEAQMKK